VIVPSNFPAPGTRRICLYTSQCHARTAGKKRVGKWKKFRRQAVFIRVHRRPKAIPLAAEQFDAKLSNMPMTLDQIVEETCEMPGEVVAELIDRIMAARHGGVEPSVAAAWKSETDRRITEIESGKVKGVTPEETAAGIQQIFGGKAASLPSGSR
jgi:Putative addiction module component